MASDQEQKAVIEVLRRAEKPMIMDLGAYQGEDSEWMLKSVAEKRPSVIMVEPDRQNYEIILRKKFSSPSKFSGQSTVVWGAIASRSGVCDFWSCSSEEGRGSGSIRRPTGHLVKNPEYKFHQTIGVPCFSLDEIFENSHWNHIDMLWVDIQAAERDMIAGGEKALRATRYMFIEAEERELYEGQALRSELLGMLPSWTVVELFDFNVLLRNEKYEAIHQASE